MFTSMKTLKGDKHRSGDPVSGFHFPPQRMEEGWCYIVTPVILGTMSTVNKQSINVHSGSSVPLISNAVAGTVSSLRGGLSCAERGLSAGLHSRAVCGGELGECLDAHSVAEVTEGFLGCAVVPPVHE
jgi:hypothetical protein